MAARLLIAALLLVGASAAAGDAAGKGNGKVDVALYYESLCPYSARFVVKHLARVFKDGLLDAADITLVPYGNARVGKDGAISCQHGPDECFLNTVEACAIDAWPNLVGRVAGHDVDTLPLSSEGLVRPYISPASSFHEASFAAPLPGAAVLGLSTSRGC